VEQRDIATTICSMLNPIGSVGTRSLYSLFRRASPPFQFSPSYFCSLALLAVSSVSFRLLTSPYQESQWGPY
jgi:hypothetical protein